MVAMGVRVAPVVGSRVADWEAAEEVAAEAEEVAEDSEADWVAGEAVHSSMIAVQVSYRAHLQFAQVSKPIHTE